MGSEVILQASTQCPVAGKWFKESQGWAGEFGCTANDALAACRDCWARLLSMRGGHFNRCLAYSMTPTGSINSRGDSTRHQPFFPRAKRNTPKSFGNFRGGTFQPFVPLQNPLAALQSGLFFLLRVGGGVVPVMPQQREHTLRWGRWFARFWDDTSASSEEKKGDEHCECLQPFNSNH